MGRKSLIIPALVLKTENEGLSIAHMSCNKSGSTYIFMQAVRGTQRGARFLHEGRVEEAIREFHSVCNRVPRRFVRGEQGTYNGANFLLKVVL